MQKEIFMTARDFVTINTTLLKNCDMKIYGAKEKNDLFAEINLEDFPVSRDNFILLIGRKSDALKILGKPAIDIRRNEKIGFVSVRFGGEDVHAVGATLYLADTSEAATKVNRELTKILKKNAHKGIIDEESGDLLERIFWTDAVWDAGKNKYLRFKDSSFGWQPMVLPEKVGMTTATRSPAANKPSFP